MPFAAACPKVRRGWTRGGGGMLRFSSVNRRGGCGFRRGMNKHHIFPQALCRQEQLAGFIAHVWPRFALADFAHNGILLPASEAAAAQCGRPIHDGPHPRYNRWVAAQIEDVRVTWRPSDPASAVLCRGALRVPPPAEAVAGAAARRADRSRRPRHLRRIRRAAPPLRRTRRDHARLAALFRQEVGHRQIALAGVVVEPQNLCAAAQLG